MGVNFCKIDGEKSANVNQFKDSFFYSKNDNVVSI